MTARRRPGSRARAGFSLTDALVALAILAALASLSQFFYGRIQQDAMTTRARSDLVVVRDAVRVYRSRHPTEPITSLRQTLPTSSVPEDPWGRPILLDLPGNRIVSQGPDPADPADDLAEPLPPPPTPVPPPAPGDTSSPVVLDAFPMGVAAGASPRVGAAYGDSGTGVAPEDASLFLDGRVLDDAEVVRSEGAISHVPAAALAAGLHRVRVVVRDRAGNVASREWDFIVP